MNKSKKEPQAPLDELYQQRKSAYKAPASVKRHILHAAKQKRDSQSLSFNVLHWTKGISLAAATAFLLSLIAMQGKDGFWPRQDKQNLQVVEIHTLADEGESLSEDIQIKYAKNYQQYLQKQQFSALHHSKKATLNITDSGWEFSTCNSELVKVSKEVILALSQLQRIEENLLQGAHVDIAFNLKGNIIGISQAEAHLRC
jgi:hypothetical protein